MTAKLLGTFKDPRPKAQDHSNLRSRHLRSHIPDLKFQNNLLKQLLSSFNDFAQYRQFESLSRN